MPQAREGYLDRYTKAIYFLSAMRGGGRFETRLVWCGKGMGGKRMGYLKRYGADGERKLGMKRCYWWRCFMAAAQRMMKKPIQSAAR